MLELREELPSKGGKSEASYMIVSSLTCFDLDLAPNATYENFPEMFE